MNHGIAVTKPVSAWNKTIKVNFKEFFKALSKAIGQEYAGNTGRSISSAVDAVSAMELGDDYGGLAWLLIYRSLLQAVFTLVQENEELLLRDSNNPRVIQYKLGTPPDDPNAFTPQLDLSLEEGQLTIDEKFFDHPGSLPVLEHLKRPFSQWLEGFGLSVSQAASIADHLRGYFVYALNEQWRERADEYTPLQKAFDTPFTKAGAKEQAWFHYSAWLRKQVDEPMFGEAFSLRQVYVPLRGYFEEKAEDPKQERTIGQTKPVNKIVVDLEQSLTAWMGKGDSADYLRVISGGPGYGKSSFTKILASRLSENSKFRVLFVPLHLIDPAADLVEAVGNYVSMGQILPYNPLDKDEGDPRLLIIFDGLDELTMQGKLAAETAQQFVLEVQRKAELLNSKKNPRLMVIISGRDLAVQANVGVLRKPQQILHVLPYFIPQEQRHGHEDKLNLLEIDQRELWWELYGKANGKNYPGMPPELHRDDFVEVTSQPLLNYLVALSYERNTLNLAEDSNLNRIYEDLLKAVYDRKWAENPHPSTAEVQEDDFIRILEEVAVSAWHGDGRKTTVREIEEHCEEGGLKGLLDALQEGASKGVTRLLMAFYFRQAGSRASGDRTFEFTHKSFGEYLTARRIVDVAREIHDDMERPQKFRASRFNEQLALERWVTICGPVAMDEYIFRFISNEMLLVDKATVGRWQDTLIRLINYMLIHGMPMERLTPRPAYQEENKQARNAEESLLAVLNACAKSTRKTSDIKWPSKTSCGEWISRLQGQRIGGINVLSMNCLSFLNMAGCTLFMRDFYGSNLKYSNFSDARLAFATLSHSDLRNAQLDNATLHYANMEAANLAGASLIGAQLAETNFKGANLKGANLMRVSLRGVNLTRANLEGADLTGAILEGADLTGANLTRTNLKGVDLEGVDLEKVITKRGRGLRDRT